MPTVVHPLRAAAQAPRVFGATHDKVPSAETSDDGRVLAVRVHKPVTSSFKDHINVFTSGGA